MKGEHDIYVLEVNGEFRVRPSVWSCSGKKEAGEAKPKVVFRNLTDWDVAIVLPEKLKAEEPRAFTLQKKGPGVKGDIVEKKFDERLIGDGEVHHYQAYILKDSGPVVAAGESDPIIIIDPPPS